MKKITHFLRSSATAQALVLFSLFPSLVLWTPSLQANPAGGIVTGGAAEIGEGLGGHLQIMQHSNRAVIDWASFSIAAGELTQFVQPGADAAVLNRVSGGTPSAIMGALQANGNVAVINTAGILVGPSGTIDVNGLLLSTLDVSNADFMAGGDMLFRGAGDAGVTNMGRINAVGGDVFLLGKTVVNSGTISAANGTVGLAAGEEVLITAVADPAGERVFVRPTAGVGGGTGVDNSGTIEGAMVELKAHGNMYALAINNSGSIRATGATKNGGKVTLRAIGGTISNSGSIAATLPDGTGGRIMIDAGVGGTVNAGGTIDASAKGDGKVGGVVMISGESVTVPGGAQISANGEGGGGFVQIGSGEGVDAQSVAVEAGSSISANGGSGPGGMVVISGGADSNVMVAGAVSATSGSGDGGIIIVEGGDVSVTQSSTLDASGANGGVITVTGENSAVVGGTLRSVGNNGNGGMINISGGNSTTVGPTASIDAGGSVNGGMVAISGGGTTSIAGTVSSVGGSGSGGSIQGLGAAVEMAASARVDASGLAGGGQVNIGGGFQGKDPGIMNATTTTVESGARIAADATGDGDGGTVVVWADHDTLFEGEVAARGAGSGRGGFVEISGKNDLAFRGTVDASSPSGRSGTVLFDPGTVNVGNGASTLPVANVNAILDGNTNIIIATHSGDIIFDNLGTGDIRDVSVQWNTDASLGVFASGDVRFLNHARTAGAGSVNVIAGWVGDESDALITANDPEAAWLGYVADGAFGIDDGDGATGIGDVYINTTTNTRSVNVGSRYGNTNIAGNNVFVEAPDGGGRYAHLGFRDDGQVFDFGTNYSTATGTDPLVAMVGVAELGDGSGVYMFDSGGATSQVLRYSDHFGDSRDGNWWWRTLDGTAGGSSGIGDNLPEMGAGISTELLAIENYGGVFGGAVKADINIEARGSLSVEAGNSGDYNSPYAQVGHGGNAHDWAKIGGYSPAANQPYSVNWGGEYRHYTAAMARLAPIFGDINIRTGLEGPSDGSAALTVSNGNGEVRVTGAQATSTSINSFSLIGHGGEAQAGSANGDINIEAGGAIGLDGGWGWNITTSIGHKAGTDNYLQEARKGVGLLADTGWTPDGKLGGGQHKQFRVFSSQAVYDDNTLRAGTLTAAATGAATDTFIPTSAYSGKGTNIYDGATVVTGKGADVFTNLEGDIDAVSHNGGVSVVGSVNTDPARRRMEQASVFIGHGGFIRSSLQLVNMEGDITVRALNGGDVSVIAGNGMNSPYAKIGHGGYVSGSSATSNYLSGDITVDADGDLVIEGGGRVTQTAVEDIAGTTNGFAMVGHGGRNSDTAFKTGDIMVTVGGDLTMTSGAYGGTFAQIGHAGKDSGGQVGGDFSRTIQVADEFGVDQNFNTTINGTMADITVDVAGNILMDSLAAKSTGEAAYVQIGHGGYGAKGDKTGDVDVDAGGDLTASGGDRNFKSVRIGHGGYDADGDHAGVITTDAVGAISFIGGTGDNTAAQIGHGGNYTSGDKAGRVDVRGDGIDFTAGQGYFSFANIGHAGRDSSGSFTGDIIVDAGAGTLSFSAGGDSGPGSNGYSWAQIGHGGYQSLGVHDGSIDVDAGEVDFRGGTTGQAYAQIGHGGYASDSDHTGDISVTSTVGDLVFDGGTGSNSYAQIGHGGDESQGYNGALANSANITVSSAGLIDFSGGAAARAYVHIGHGGYNSDGDTLGDVMVSSVGDITFDGGGAAAGNLDHAYAQIGHGGYGNNGNHRGAITVTGGPLSSIVFNAGLGSTTAQYDGEYSYAMIGHGGSYAGGVGFELDGDINVTSGTGGIDFTASDNSYFAHAMIGHGGRDVDGNKIGDINVTAAGGGITFTAGGADLWSRYAHAQIGHGGYGNVMEGDFTGDITVTSNGGGGVSLNGGVSYGNYAMVGHGGFGGGQIVGTATGDVTVIADGDILLDSGTDSYTFAQIGHGGRNFDGDTGLAGEQISVVSNNGDIELRASNYSDAVAMIGHGDNNDGSGDRRGDILVSATNGELSLVTDGSLAWIGHRTIGGTISDADVTIVAQSVDDTTGNSGTTIFDVGGNLGNNLQADLAGGDVSLHAVGAGGLWMNSSGNMVYTSDHDFNMLSEADVYITNDIITKGLGDVNVVAGWDPVTAPLTNPVTGIIAGVDMDTSIFPVVGSFGNNGGDVFVGLAADGLGTDTGAGADTGVTVASRDGQTNVAGRDVNVWGYPTTGGGVEVSADTRKYSKIGYDRDDAGDGTASSNPLSISGRIRVNATNDIRVESNKGAYGTEGSSGWTATDLSGYASHAQIGHGGDRDSVDNITVTGDIIVESGNDVVLRGGITRENFAMIGHGGYANSSDIPNGLGGDITVTAGNDLDVRAGNGYYAFAQVGHGGANVRSTAFTSSTIDVTTGGDVVFQGGMGVTGTNTISHAQLGHGGFEADLAAGGYAGAITVNASGGIEFSGGVTSINFAQLGHGGYASNGNHSGNISVTAANGAVTLDSTAGGSSAYTQIGHGGDSSKGDFGGVADTIQVSASDNVELLTGVGTQAYAQIGNGGYNADADAGDATGHLANITVTAGSDGSGSVRMVSTGALGGDIYASTQIGNGGSVAGGDHGGTVNVTAADDVVLTGGDSRRSSALIGHGGYNTDAYGVGHSGNVSVTASNGSVLLSGGSGAYSFAMVGNGGFWADGDHSGNVSVSAGDAIALDESSAGSYSFSQIGHGGYDPIGDLSGVITVDAVNDIDVIGGGGSVAFAMIGHGGYNDDPTWDGDKDGKIVVYSSAGDINVLAGAGTRGYAQIGHGGLNNSGDFSHGGIGCAGLFVAADVGDITVGATGSVGTDSYGMIGSGDGIPLGTGDRLDAVVITLGTGNFNLLPAGVLGHMTASPTTPIGGLGEFQLTVGGNFSVIPGGGPDIGGDDISGAAVAAQLGGGMTFTLLAGGDITIDDGIVYSGGKDLTFAAMNNLYVNANIQNSQAAGGGDVNLIAGWDGLTGRGHFADGPFIFANCPPVDLTTLNFDMAAIKADSTTWGNGDGVTRGLLRVGSGTQTAGIAVGSRSGTTNVLGRNVEVLGSTGTGGAYAQIGYRTDIAGDNATGAIMAWGKEGGVTLDAGTTDAAAQVGHGGLGGNTNVKDLSGMISVRADFGATDGDITVEAGSGTRAFAQIGHGGRNNDGNHGGEIVVIGKRVEVSSGAGGTAGQIGHGGFGVNGNLTGNIFVNYDPAANGGLGAAAGGGEAVMLTGSNGFDAFTQIGHGGVVAGSGIRSGNILIGESASVTVQAGSNWSGYSKIGHGGVGNTSSMSGDITVNTQGDVNLLAGTGYRAFAQVGHGGENSDGVKSGDIAIKAANAANVNVLGGNSGVNTREFAQIGHGGHGSSGNASGLVSLYAPNAAVAFDGGLFTESYAQFGHGGHLASGDHSGRQEMLADSISFAAGVGDRAYAQFGHGGHTAGTGGSATVGNTGDISLAATTGDILFSGGSGLQTYAHLGHGGYGTTGSNSGNIVARSGGDFLLTPGTGAGAYAQAGHGGTNAAGDTGHTGSLTISAGTFDPDLQFTGVVANRNYTDVFDVNGDGVIDALDVVNITNNTVAGVRVGAGAPGGAAGAGAYSQIGHGGMDAHGNHGAAPVADGIYLESTAGLQVNGGGTADASAQVGHGGQNVVGNLNGRIKIGAEGGISVQGGTADRSYAQIGLGGHDDVAGVGDIEGDKDGMVVVFSRTGNVDVTGGAAAGAYGQVGHGGLNNDGDFMTEDLGLFVFAGSTAGPASAGDLSVTTGAAPGAYGMVGLGDGGPLGVPGSVSGTGDRIGLVSTGANGNIFDLGVIGNQTAAGNIVDSGSVNLAGGDYYIGLPGPPFQETGAEVVSRILLADYAVGAAGSIFVNQDVVFGSGNDFSLMARDNIFVNASIQNSQAAGGGDVSLIAGWDEVTGLGTLPFIWANTPPAGRSFDAALVEADPSSYGIGDGITQGLVRIGDGSQARELAVGSRSGTTRVLGHTLALNAGAGNGDYARIGFQTSAGNTSASGAIKVAMKGAIALAAGPVAGSHAQIGHGATYLAGGALGGDISVVSEGLVPLSDITLTGGAGLDNFAQVGHGGVQNTADKGGSILVRTGDGDVLLTSGAGEKGYSQVGHGGVNAGAPSTQGGAADLVEVDASGSVTLRASDGGLRAYSQIGNGGFNADAPTTAGDVRVTAGDTVTVVGGAAQQAHAQIGHGGGAADGDKSGVLIVEAGDGLMAGSVALSRGAGSDAYAKIGHGDQAFTSGAVGSASGTIDGGIQVTAGEGMVSTGGMVGHVDPGIGGPAVAGSGSTFVAVSRNDFPAMMMSGDGTLVADAASVFSSGAGGELRFYMPRRDSNQVAAGASLNGTAYIGGLSDPALQRSDEFYTSLGQHTNLNTAAANAAGLVLNLDPVDAANYSTALGDYSFYFDTGTLTPAPDGGGGGGGEEVAPPAPPAPPIFVTIDGQLFFNRGVFGPGSPYVQVGPYAVGFTDDYFNWDAQRYELDMYDSGDKRGWGQGGPWTSTFEAAFSKVEGGAGWSSFTVFGNPDFTVGGYGFGFDGINNPPEMDDELRRMLEALEAELAELRGSGE